MGEVIQLVVAPVFLLVAVGSLLGVVTGRLGRVVDRARELEDRLIARSHEQSRNEMVSELHTLDARMRCNHWSINFLCISALIVAVLVATLFISYSANGEFSRALPTLFVSAMASIMLGILCFIAEVYLATKTVRVHFELL